MRKISIILIILSLTVSAFAFGEGKYFKKGLKAMNAGDYITAKVFFNEAINKNPKFSRGYSHLALSQAYLGETDNAIMNYKLAYKFDKKDYSSLTNLCGLYIDKGNMNAAHKACTQAISINPQSHVALNNRCRVFLQSKRYDSAIADCSQAILVKSDYTNAYNNRGTAYLAIGRYESAVSDFDMAIKNNPMNATAYSNRCSAKKELKIYEEALADCDKATSLDRNLAEAYFNKGAVYEMLGQKSDAAFEYSRYLKFHPEAESVRQKMKRLLKGE